MNREEIGTRQNSVQEHLILILFFK